MSRKAGSILNLVVALSMVLTLFAVQPAFGSVQAQDPTPEPPSELMAELREFLQKSEEISPETALKRIDPALREQALARGKEQVDIFVSIKGSADVEKYLTDAIRRPFSLLGVHTIFGRVMASDLIKLAQEPGVVSIVDASLKEREQPFDPENEPDQAAALARIEYLQANELTHEEAMAATGGVGAQGWFDVETGHESDEAWKKGFTGNGVIVGVIDDGIDFGHPDLMGTTARVTDPDSPYYGWPMAFSQASTQYFAYDVFLGTNFIDSQASSSRWASVADAVEVSAPFEGGTGTAWFQPLGSGVAYEYTIPLTSASGIYKFTSLPENNLNALYGHKVAVLVVDEGSSGDYDTVYVDLDNDKDFTDEKPATQADPEIWRDMDGDGYTDISGGMLVWISDGDNPPPNTDWLWGITCGNSSATMQGCPDSGDLVLFTGALAGGYSHGTQCASNVAGQGAVNGGLSAQPFRTYGMVTGAAPEASLMDLGNFYVVFADEDHYLVAALGYDGIPGSGDEIQITSNSYGSFGQMWGSFGYIGRLLTAINLVVSPETAFLFSAGNEGPGYGPQEGDGGATTIQVGSSTQFGSTNWDSIVSHDQVVWGDITTFFSKGPNRDGSSGLDVLANGGRGAGSEAINYYGYNGWTSWATWGGTSRSAPVAAGNLALVYDAYYARYGEFPDWDTAKALLKSGADNPASAPFFQGAGVVNSDRSTDLAAGLYGVYATPTEWQVGDWKGEQYLAFPSVAEPGGTYSQTYTVKNPSGYEVTVDLSDGYMTRIDEYEFQFTTSPQSEESSFNFHAPDYLIDMDESQIPEDAELMVVRFVHPYDTFDPDYSFTNPPNSSWRQMVYSWTDINGDGMLWEDADGNGVVNHVDDLELGFDNDGFLRPDFDDPRTEIQQGEYVRMDYSFGGLALPIYIRDPIERMRDGYFIGLQHRYNDGSVDTTTFTIGVEFYKRADWPWLSLSDASLTVPAEGEAEFTATVSLPADAAPGAYEGVIYMNDPGHLHHEAHETALPVVINVISDLPDDGSVLMGGGGRDITLYQNSISYGYFNLYGGGWQGAGDWRHYFLDISEGDVANQNLLVHTSWDDEYPTDFNNFVLGPTEDCVSNGVDCEWPLDTGLFDPPWPDIFGPYTLWPISQSEPFRAGATYPFQTSSGGPDDWLAVPLTTEGLHEIAVHNVLYAGEDLYTNFQVDVGTLQVDAEVAGDEGVVTTDPFVAEVYDDSGEINLWFTSTLELPDLYATLEGGLEVDTFGPFTVFIPDTDQCFDPYCPGNVYEEFIVDQEAAIELEVFLDVTAGQDVDTFLIYDSNNNGVRDPGVDGIVGSSGNSAGSDEVIVVANPQLGRYWAVFDGYDVDPDSGVNQDWWYTVTYPGGLPSDPVDVFNGPAPIGQDAPFDPTTASFSQTVTTSDRTAAIHAMVTDIPAGSDVDLYISDPSGEIIAVGQMTGNADEHLIVRPEEGYRFEAGLEYTVWVHGLSVPTPPINPTVHIWTDELNVWLSATHPDVHALQIEPGEAISVTIHFDKPGWAPGDPPLSARVVAGPSELPNAFDRLLVIDRVVMPGDPVWDPDNLTVIYDVESARGPSPFSPWSINGVPAPTALAGPSETVTWTLTVRNDDPDFATPALTLYAEIDNLFQTLITTDPYLEQTDVTIVDAPAIGTATYIASNAFVGTPVISWEGSLDVGEEVTFSWTATTDANMMPLEDHLSLVYDPWYFWLGMGEWDSIAGADVYFRTFRTDGSTKMASADPVAPGEAFDYTFTLTNATAEDREVFMYDPLPEEVEFVSSGNPDVSYDPVDHVVTWSGMLPGSSVETVDVTFTVSVLGDVPEGTEIVNEAFLSDRFFGTPFATLESTTLVDDGLYPDLQVSKTVDELMAVAGTTVEYTIVIENVGTEAAADVELTDVIPDGLIVDEASITGGAMLDGNVLTWTGDLGIGESHTITFEAMVSEDLDDEYALINGAHVEAANFAGSAFNSAVTEVDGVTSIHLPLVFR